MLHLPAGVAGRRPALAALLLPALLAAPLSAPGAGASRAGAGAFRLFAAQNVLLRANRVECNITAAGELCVDPTNSPIRAGGFWPRGTDDGYVFVGGLLVAAIVPGQDQPGFPWPGDTVGALFVEPRGGLAHGATITGIHDSRAVGAGRWPAAAHALDPALFNSTLLGSDAVSEQDTWTRYWDLSANPNGRSHPMGILVEQRTLAWNYPVGNEDIVYQVFRFVNVTASDAARYAGLAAAGYGPDDISGTVALGRLFQRRMRLEHGVEVPDTGYAFTQLHVGFYQDPDVGNPSHNYSTANLPFALALAYKHDFRQPDWTYPADVFFTPFLVGPGLVGQALVRSPAGPADAGFVLWSNLTGGNPFPPPRTVEQWWRVLSANMTAVDGACGVPLDQLRARRFCLQVSTYYDTRYMMSAGPFTLQPGGSFTLVMAQLHAGAVEAAVAPGGVLALSVSPGLPLDGARLAQGLDTVRTIDRAAGWVSHTDANGDGVIAWNEVVTVPRSLLWKAQLAQAVAASGFLPKPAPEPPAFLAIPGDRRVTVVWEPSATERAGDPYFPLAADPTSPLYDPNFRRFDVEGYRVWRGRTPTSLELVAQLDYTGIYLTDYTGRFTGSDYGTQCAPELGITVSCPALPHGIYLGARPIVQIRPGYRVILANGAVGVLHADTLVPGGRSGSPPLGDTRVPFVFTDSGLTNGVTYFYAVTAFDANSFSSGPSSCESAAAPRAVTPRTPGATTRAATVVTGVYGADNVQLDINAAFPSMDPKDGTFAGPIPPANGGMLELIADASELLPVGEYVLTLDSIEPGFAGGIGRMAQIHYTFAGADTTQRGAFPLPWAVFDLPPTAVVDDTLGRFALAPYDSAAMRRYGASLSNSVPLEALFRMRLTPFSAASAGIALSSGRFGRGDQVNRYLAHSRWFDAGASEPPDPTIDPFGSAAHTAGRLSGVSAIYAPQSYRSPLSGPDGISENFRGYSYAAGTWYPGDFEVTWGSGGSITVRDLTHHVDLPFKRSLQSGWGFLNQRALAAAGVTDANISDGQGAPSTAVLSYHHLYAINPVCTPDWWDIRCAPLESTAQLQPVDITNDGVGEGMGIGIVVNGEAFLMLMNALPSAGARWRLRAVGYGFTAATCTPPLPPDRNVTLTRAGAPRDCDAYAYAPLPVRPALAPGLRFKLAVTRAFAVTPESGDLRRVHTVPDPYYLTNSLEATLGRQVLRFVNLPDRAVIRIYSTSGILVAMLTHNDPTGGGEAQWDVRSRNGQRVASGVYFFHVEAADGRSVVGRFTIVQGEP